MLSKKFIAALKLGPKKAYEVAQEAGIHPATLSKLVCGIEKIKPNDQRVIRVGKVLGVPENEYFDDNGNGKPLA
jgi:transcriptional regulator with XRE-family HTH domain